MYKYLAFNLPGKEQRFSLAQMLSWQTCAAPRSDSSDRGRCRWVAARLSHEELTPAGEPVLRVSHVHLHLSHSSPDALCNSWVEMLAVMCQQENILVKSQNVLVFLWNWHKETWNPQLILAQAPSALLARNPYKWAAASASRLTHLISSTRSLAQHEDGSYPNPTPTLFFLPGRMERTINI